MSAFNTYLNFLDDEVCQVVRNRSESTETSAKTHPASGTYLFTYGILVKARSSLMRVVKRSYYRVPAPSEGDTYADRMHWMLRCYLADPDELNDWKKDDLWDTAEEVVQKARSLNTELEHDFYRHHVERNPSTGQLVVSTDFLRKVKQYHADMARPDHAFQMDAIQHDARTLKLASLPRLRCPRCYGLHQIYCGPCEGVTMPNAVPLLPVQKLKLPFDILLLFHWRESLHHCTGVHAKIFCEEGTVAIKHWKRHKTDADWEEIIGGLDSERDVLLFPSPDAVPADEFPWDRRYDTGCYGGQSESTIGQNSSSGNDIYNYSAEGTTLSIDDETTSAKIKSSSSRIGSDVYRSTTSHRWRLVVLEGSWTAGKTMAMQIVEHRLRLKLPPLRTVILRGVVGEYWRFHGLGHAAVSTIEAIAHTARAAAAAIATATEIKGASCPPRDGADCIGGYRSSEEKCTALGACSAAEKDKEIMLDRKGTAGADVGGGESYTKTGLLVQNARGRTAAYGSTVENAVLTKADVADATKILATDTVKIYPLPVATSAAKHSSAGIHSNTQRRQGEVGGGLKDENSVSLTDAVSPLLTTCVNDPYSDLLIIFRVQKYRVFQRMETGEAVPLAVKVSGYGIGCWDALIASLPADADSSTDTES